MKRIFLLLIAAVIFTFASCQSSDLYTQLPGPISKFISNYWPNPAIESYAQPSAESYTVTIKNGPTLDFNGSYSWTSVSGNGLPLPQQFLFDQLPSKLYDYIESGSMTGEVFAVSRNASTYTAQLLTSTITYDTATASVRTAQ